MRHDLLDGMPRLIQAGMGVHISSAQLANVTARLGALGVVSSVGLRTIVAEQVRAGDVDVIRLAQTFPIKQYVEELMEFAKGGQRHNRMVPMDDLDPAKSELPKRLSTIASYIEVMRAKQGHYGKIGINVMWKCALTALPSIYGAMIAGVDALLCGAGVPMELPDVVSKIREGCNLSYHPLTGTSTSAKLNIEQDQLAGFLQKLHLPHMMPILSNFAFPKRIMDIWEREHNGARPFAFVLENHTAGGHNAPPRNKVEFSEQDDIERYFDKVHGLGVPIYVAGAFPTGGSREDFLYWTERGAYGIQVGSRFALCDESGMRPDLKNGVIAKNAEGKNQVGTSKLLSPTGYPFKYVPLEGTLSEPDVYNARKRICNRGYLLEAHQQQLPDGTTRETYICPAMPEKQYMRLGGQLPEMDERVCLCNALFSTAGLYADKEPPVITLGVSGQQVTRKFTAREIMEDIMTPEYVAISEKELAG